MVSRYKCSKNSEGELIVPQHINISIFLMYNRTSPTTAPHHKRSYQMERRMTLTALLLSFQSTRSGYQILLGQTGKNFYIMLLFILNQFLQSCHGT